jgi:hypothetical protein
LQKRAVTETKVPHEGQRCSSDSLQTGQKCHVSSTAEAHAGQVRSVELPHDGQNAAADWMVDPQIGHVRMQASSDGGLSNRISE